MLSMIHLLTNKNLRRSRVNKEQVLEVRPGNGFQRSAEDSQVASEALVLEVLLKSKRKITLLA